MNEDKGRLQESLDKVWQTRLERREFMRRLGLTAIAVAGLPQIGQYAWAQEETPSASELVPGKNDQMVVYNTRTIVLGTPLELQRQHRITPISLQYVRNNQLLEGAATTEPLGVDDWTFEIDGLVAFPKIVTLAELRDMEQRDVEMVLQCSGNGRSFYARAAQTSGTQWEHGAVGNVVFRGVPLRTLIESLELGIAPVAEFITAQGKDLPPEGGSRPDFEHSVPLDDVLDKAIIALEMNGETLPAIHGGPVRLVIPGYYGTMNVKWLGRLRFDAHQTNNYNQIPRYRIPDHPIEPGSSYDYTFENSIPNWNQFINSIIFAPLKGASVNAGTVEVSGVAWNDGVVPVTAVEISTDNGATWKSADIEKPDSSYAWHHWRANVELQPGEQRIWSRAIDAWGHAQPLDGTITWNPSGYAWHGADIVDVTVN